METKEHELGEWVSMETRPPDQVGPSGRRPKNTTVSVVTGKGRKAKNVKLRIPASMFPEIKRYYQVCGIDAQAVGQPGASSVQKDIFAGVTSGTGAGQRLGNSIFVKKVVFRLYCVQDTTINFSNLNFAFVHDLEPAAAAPLWSTVWEPGGSGAGQYNVVIPADDERFRYKYDQRFTVPLHWTAVAWNGSTYATSTKPFTGVVEIPINRRIDYSSSATARPFKGEELTMWAWSDAGSNKPFLTASWEVFFTDA